MTGRKEDGTARGNVQLGDTLRHAKTGAFTIYFQVASSEKP